MESHGVLLAGDGKERLGAASEARRILGNSRLRTGTGLFEAMDLKAAQQ